MATRTEIYEWQPGDGVSCSWSTRGSKHIPCGPPVVTYKTIDDGNYYSRPRRVTRRVACAFHIPNMPTSGEMGGDIEKVAREQLIVNHWDEFQSLLNAEIKARVEERFAHLPEAIRELVAKQAGVEVGAA